MVSFCCLISLKCFLFGCTLTYISVLILFKFIDVEATFEFELLQQISEIICSIM